MRTLTDFLKSHRYDKSKHNIITNTRIPDQENGICGGSYYISDEEYPEFLELYKSSVLVKEKYEYLTEKQLEKNAPILIDLDFRYDSSIKTRQYTSVDIDDIVDAYLAQLKTIYQFDEDTNFNIFVLEKSEVNCLPDKTKDGIHIIITIGSDRATQILLRKKMLEPIKTIFEGSAITNKVEDILDEGISAGHVGWQLFGSCKPQHEPYKLTRAYTVTFDTTDNEFMFDWTADYDFIENLNKLSARNTDNYFAFFTSKFAEEHAQSTNKKPEVKNTVVSTTSTNVNTKSDEFLIRRIIESGIVTSWASGTKWTEFGWVLKNTFEDKLGWELFDLFSKLDTKEYDLISNRAKWDSWKVRDDLRTKKNIGWLIKSLQKTDKDKITVIQQEFKQQKKQENIENGIIFVDNDEDACIAIFEKIKDILISTDKGRLFYKKNNIWLSEMSVIDNHILQYILTSQIYRANEEFIQRPYVSNISSARNVRDTLFIKIRTENVIDNFYQKLHTTTKGRICFKDGILDFKQKKFIIWEDVKFEYYSTEMIPFEFGEYFKNPNNELISNIKRDIYENMFGDKTTVALNFLSRAIAGHFEDKNWSTYLGNRNCGKGVLFDSLKNAFGSYISPFELNNIMYQRKSSSNTDESSKKLYWALDLEFARIAMSQEIPPPETNLVVNGARLKKLAGGGDTIIARRNYDRIDTYFNIDTTFMFLGNNVLEVDVKDTMEHCIQFSSVNQFKTQEEIDQLKSEGANELFWSSFKVKDSSIKNNCCTDEWKKATVYLIYQNYVNSAVTVICDKSEDNEITLRQKILEHYDITGDINDIIRCDIVYEYIRDSNKKIVNELVSMGVTKKESKVRDNNRGKQCFYGIKVKDIEVVEELSPEELEILNTMDIEFD